MWVYFHWNAHCKFYEFDKCALHCSHTFIKKVKLKVTQVCLTLCDPMGIVHGILQARILDWVAFPFFRGSSQLRDQTQVSCTGGRFFTIWASREPSCDAWDEAKIPTRTTGGRSWFQPSWVTMRGSRLQWRNCRCGGNRRELEVEMDPQNVAVLLQF